jgi:hypothetical protein
MAEIDIKYDIIIQIILQLGFIIVMFIINKLL